MRSGQAAGPHARPPVVRSEYGGCQDDIRARPCREDGFVVRFEERAALAVGKLDEIASAY
jgi:hypothetical protein